MLIIDNIFFSFKQQIVLKHIGIIICQINEIKTVITIYIIFGYLSLISIYDN